MKPRTATAPAVGFDWLMDWIYPPRCRACHAWIRGRDSEYFCHACKSLVQTVGHPLCLICGRPFPGSAGDDHICGPCLAHPPRYRQARAWACYPHDESADHPLRAVIQKFKYGRKVSLGKPLGRLLAHGCEPFLRDLPIDVIVPVPLHARRLRWRGFNQAVILARQLGLHYGVPMDPMLLERTRETPPQTQLTEAERRRNVRDAFVVARGKSVGKKCTLLVDDVYTSGATVNACSQALLRGKAKAVYVVTLARTVS